MNKINQKGFVRIPDQAIRGYGIELTNINEMLNQKGYTKKQFSNEINNLLQTNNLFDITYLSPEHYSANILMMEDQHIPHQKDDFMDTVHTNELLVKSIMLIYQIKSDPEMKNKIKELVQKEAGIIDFVDAQIKD